MLEKQDSVSVLEKSIPKNLNYLLRVAEKVME
jgi:hypothetical protein